jgi:hypothetical protein
MTYEELFANSQQNQATPEVAPAQSQNFISKVLGVLRPNLGSPGSFDRLKMQDLVPNIFGVNDPNVEGLLGADQSKSLQSRSNIAGLLGAAAALSQGMSRGGPRRSALQNILGAAAGGYGAAGQQYQQGLQTVGQQQQLAQQMRERDKARLIQQDIERVMQMPEVANNAPLMAALRADPIPALKFINENMPISRAYEQIPTALVQQPGQIADPVFAAGQAANNQLANGAEDPSLAPVVSRNANPEEQIKRLLLANERLTPLSTKAAREAIESNIKQIELIRKNIATEGLMNFNFSKAREGIPPQSLPAFDLIQQSVEQGIVDPKDLPKMLQDLSQKPGDVQSYLYAKTEGYQGNFEKWKQGPGRVAPNLSFDLRDPARQAQALSENSSKYIANKNVSESFEIANRFNNFTQAYNNPQAGGASDAVLIYSMAKMLDPGGAVQQGDIGTIAGQKSIPERLQAIHQQFVNSRILSDEQRQNLNAMAYSIMKNKRKALEPVIKQYRNYATSLQSPDPTADVQNPFENIELPKSRVVTINQKRAVVRLGKNRETGEQGYFYTAPDGKTYPYQD